MAASDLVEKGMKLHAKFSDGEFYPAEVTAVKKGKKEKKPVKVKFTQYPDEDEVWVSMADLKSKKLPKADVEPAAPKEKAKAKAKAKVKEEAKGGKDKETGGKEEARGGKDTVKIGKDKGAGALGMMTSFASCVMAEYVWLDAEQVPRSKTKVMTHRPSKVSDLGVWNYDGSSTGQAEGHNSEINIQPRAWFNDPFRGYPHIMVVCDCWNAWDDKPAIGNTRAACAEEHEKYKKMDTWYGIEQEYTLMKACKVGEKPKVPYGFNANDSEPAPQGPYYCGSGTGIAIGRPVADEHLAKCLAAGVKLTGINSEVMPGQWEYQVGPCRGVEVGDHMTMARYIMLRVTESHGCKVSFDPKPAEGDWNGAGCHTNISTKSMRTEGGYEVIKKVCEAFGKVAKEHIAEYGEDNDKRLTGKHETCSINDFKFAVADRGASIRIPRSAEKTGKGYMEDRRPGANCDAYRVTARIMKTIGECLAEAKEEPEEKAE